MSPDQIVKNEEGYLTYDVSGERVIFYTCDPVKNKECNKSHCRTGIPEGMGFCAATTNPEYQAEGTRPFYKRFKDEGYFGREYVGEVGS